MSGVCTYSAPTRRSVTFTPEAIKKAGGLLPVNVKLADGAFVTAARFLSAGETESLTCGLVASSEKTYCVLQNGLLRDAETNNGYLLRYLAKGALSYTSPQNAHAEYVYGAGGVHRIADGTLTYLTGHGAVSAAAVFHERLFLASGSVITYSVPLDVENFDLTERDAGKIELSDVGGEILSLVPYGDCVLVFRPHEILELKADANDLNFAFSKVKFDGGAIKAGSVQSCGRYVLFQTERGFYSLEGGRCSKAETGDAVVPCAEALSASHAGIYYAAVTVKGERRILAYDPEEEEYYLLGLSSTMLAGSAKGLWLNEGSALWRLTEEEGDPLTPSYIEFFPDLAKYAAKYVLEGVSVLGEGSYTLTLQRESGREIVRTVKAPQTVGFRHTLPLLKTKFILQSAGEMKFRGLVLHLREVGA